MVDHLCGHIVLPLLTHCLLYVPFPCSSHPCVSGSISDCCSAEPGSHLVPQRQTPASKEGSSRRECPNTIPGKGRRTSRKVCCCHHKAFRGFTFDLVCAVHIPRACACVPTLGSPVCNGCSPPTHLFAPSFPNRPVRQMAKKESKKSKTQGKKNAANEGVAGESAHWFHLPTCNVRMAYFS